MTTHLTERGAEREEATPIRPIPDRRTRRRLPLSLRVEIEASPGEGPSDAVCGALGLTRDISVHGAYLWSARQFDTGQLLHLTLEVPPERGRNWTVEIHCEAEVVRVEAERLRAEQGGVAVRILRFRIPRVDRGYRLIEGGRPRRPSTIPAEWRRGKP